MSEITMSHRSKKNDFRDIFDESNLEVVEEMEFNAIDNKNNIFYNAYNNSIHNQILPIHEVDEKSVKPYKDERELYQDEYSNSDESENNHGLKKHTDDILISEEKTSKSNSNSQDIPNEGSLLGEERSINSITHISNEDSDSTYKNLKKEKWVLGVKVIQDIT